jgi:hypothetical protein
VIALAISEGWIRGRILAGCSWNHPALRATPLTQGGAALLLNSLGLN